MRKSGSLAILIAILGLVACEGDPAFVRVTGVDDVADVSVLTSSPTLPSDGSQPATITVTVSDASGLPIAGVEVLFSADSGSLVVADPPTTGTDGSVTATLDTGGDATNRTITVTATAGAVEGTVTVDVVGTGISLSGPLSLAIGNTGNYTATLQDSAGNGVEGVQVDISSSSGNTLSATSMLSDAAGEVNFQVTAAVSGADTITATALGLNATLALDVTDETFVLTAPAAGAQITVNTDEPVELTWLVAGVPQAGQTITFSTTLGTLSSPTAITDANGIAAVTINSATAGAAIIDASNAAGTTAQLDVEFVAAAAASGLTKLSSAPASLAASDPGPAAMDTSANILLATNNVVYESGSSSYGVTFAVRVTDSSGAAIEGVTLSGELSLNALFDGTWNWEAQSGKWVQSISAGPCVNEFEVEDLITISSQEGPGGAIVTGADGWAYFALNYPQEFARWADVTLYASALVDNVDVSATSSFFLPVKSSHTTSLDQAPSGLLSPASIGTSCSSNY